MKFSWDEINQHILNKYDLLICSASYEDRSISFAYNCPDGKVSYALVCHYQEYNEQVDKNLTSLRSILTAKNVQYDEAKLSHIDPIASVDTVILKFHALERDKRLGNVLIDITTFTREMLLILLRVFHDLFPRTHVSYVYSNAEDYDPQAEDNKTTIDQKWLSKGITEIRSVIGYPGNLQPTNNTHLLIIVGYEYDRALSIISELEPSSLSLAFGRSHSFTTEGDLSGKHYGAKEHFDELTSSALAYFPEEKFHVFEVSCNSPVKTKAEIEGHLHSIGVRKEQHNIIVFALNNKPSTLGVGLYGIDNEDVQLCYAPALLYNYGNYSKPGKYCYLFDGI